MSRFFMRMQAQGITLVGGVEGVDGLVMHIKDCRFIMAFVWSSVRVILINNKSNQLLSPATVVSLLFGLLRSFAQQHMLMGLTVMCLLITSGCRSPLPVIQKEASVLDAAWGRRSEDSLRREVRVLVWADAVRLLNERNPELRRADAERVRAKRDIGQVYRNLLPYMQLSAGINKRVDELDSISFNDMRWDLNAYAFLSGILNLRRDVYSAELSYIRINLVRELTFREKVVELHRMFLASRQLQIARQRLSESERVLRDIPVARRSLESAPATVDSLREQLRAQQAKLDGGLIKLLDLAEFRVELKDGGLPDVDYSKDPLDKSNTSRVGVLRRKLFAIELVGAQARVRGAQLQHWPDISLFLTSGSLWTTSGGQTVWWEAKDLRLTASAYLPIDLNGTIRNRVSDAKTDLAFLQREIDLREAILISEFDDKRSALVQVERDVLEQERKRSLLMQLISIEGAENLGERLRQWSEIEAQRGSAVEQRAQLNAFFLFFDEGFWSGPSAPAAMLPSPGTIDSRLRI